jgi:hypothetical protein
MSDIARQQEHAQPVDASASCARIERGFTAAKRSISQESIALRLLRLIA